MSVSKMMIEPGATVELRRVKGVPEQVHVFAKREIQAVNTALAAGRPLLLRGEPGVGKSQLAKAAAKVLGRAFVSKTVDANTEAHHLLWRFDAVARLAEAQVQGALLGPCEKTRDDVRQSVMESLALEKFIYPEALWWALNWKSASDQAEKAHVKEPVQSEGYDVKNGVVALIDEIDKADADVPNGLLEALGSGSFRPFGMSEDVSSNDPHPLIVVTTNGERSLPDAFVRRCLVLKMELPRERDGEDGLVAHLIKRAAAHFPAPVDNPGVNDELFKEAARLLARDREDARTKNLRPLPGQAEYFDLLRAVRRLAPDDPEAQADLLNDLADFALKKGD